MTGEPSTAVPPVHLVLLVHHADALSPDRDPLRPLSRQGVAQAEWLAQHARDAGLSPAVIWHSGKLRARQTAEALLVRCNPGADLRAVRGLRPEDTPGSIVDALEGEQRQLVAIVSHMPLLPDLLEAMTLERRGFPLHGMVLVERESPRRYRERWRVSPAA